MKSNKNIFTKVFLCVLTAIGFLFFSKSAVAQPNLQKAIKSHIEKVREDASEYKEARQIVYGDVDGDGVKDAVVKYTLEGAAGGNSWGQNLAVFLNKKGAYKISAEETVGGKFFRSFDLLKILNREIIAATETCPENNPQGMCKNPKREQVKFVLLKGKLKEK